ncbi:MAG: TldD/PmbA family protein [Candidatus Cryptobacteroides sp.]
MELIDSEEIELAEFSIREALKQGVEGANVTLNKSISDTCIMRDGILDNIQHRLDRNLTFKFFSNGHYGSFSTNRISRGELASFISKAVRTLALMEPDECRQLPPAECMATDASGGYEAGLWDRRYYDTSPDERVGSVSKMHIRNASGDGWTVVSEENEYSDYAVATLLLDSRGYRMVHFESGFSCSSDITILSGSGERFSSYWWEVSPFKDGIDPRRCAETALKKAVASIGPEKTEGGRMNMVVDGNIASRLLSPVTDALSCMSIQQNMSFLCGSKGKKMFSEGLSLRDDVRARGRSGAKLFDNEGSATIDLPVIENGVVINYFTNTWAANKTGELRTNADISRPVLKKWLSPNLKSGSYVLQSEGKSLSLADILEICGDGIYVTDFNGGNCNGVTGDFSFGVSGFVFRDGKIGQPFREMLITGNMIGLWNNLVAVGDDERDCGAWRLPSLAFGDVACLG